MSLRDPLTKEHGNEARVLVIDDEYEIGQVLQLGLARAHFTVHWAATGQEGMDLVTRWHPDLILLDLTLPDIDGLTLCRQIRAWTTVPIVILSVRSATHDIVTALESGADDYVTKPFHMDELIARMRVALRHASQEPSDRGERIEIGDLVMDLASRQVTIRGQAVHLSPTEYDVLAMLARYAGRVVTHQALLSAVWGPQFVDAVHYLRICMAALRRKLEVNPSQPRLLLTEPGIGYRFNIDQ
ncbi:MAG TPA: response regulator transcription factor [Ktedonobacterales bacterium]|nr:response regulator transcription factor [Ktedonobacterales bacterium]